MPKMVGSGFQAIQAYQCSAHVAKKKMKESQTFRLPNIPKCTQKLLDFVDQYFAQQIQKVPSLAPTQRDDIGTSVEGFP